MGINIHIQKKDLWLLAAIGIFLVGVAYVIAYNSGAQPSVFGHSAEELEVEIGGNTYNLQEAITNNLLGGGGSDDCRWVESFPGIGLNGMPWGDECTSDEYIRGVAMAGCRSSDACVKYIKCCKFS